MKNKHQKTFTPFNKMHVSIIIVEWCWVKSYPEKVKFISISLFNMIDAIDMENVLKPDKIDVNPNSSDASKIFSRHSKTFSLISQRKSIHPTN